MLPPVWGLWCLTLMMQGRTAPAAFLPFSAEGFFRAFNNLIMEQNQETLANEQFGRPVDISKLPPNYHNEEEKQRKMGNATLYSRHEINKVTDNRTGEMIFSEKTVTSIEGGDTLPEKKVPKPVASQTEAAPEADRQIDGVRFFTESPPKPRPRLTFLIFRFPRRLKSKQMPEGSWIKEEPISDKKHRLLAIRNGLLTVPRPIKKRVLPAAPQQKLNPQKRHFFFFWRKI